MLLTILYVVHTVALGSWFGTQVYSVLLVQRHPAQQEDPELYEDFATRMAHGTRYNLLGVIIAMVPTWVAIVVLRVLGDVELGAVWMWLVVLKSLAMFVTVLLFGYLSWHVWPQRIFALPHELPLIRRRFYGLSVGILSLTGFALAIGIVEQSVGSLLAF